MPEIRTVKLRIYVPSLAEPTDSFFFFSSRRRHTRWTGDWSSDVVLFRSRVLHLDESHLERARGFFDRHGAKAVFFGRFIALLRTWAAVLAGVGRMPYRTFMLYNALRSEERRVGKECRCGWLPDV